MALNYFDKKLFLNINCIHDSITEEKLFLENFDFVDGVEGFEPSSDGTKTVALPLMRYPEGLHKSGAGEGVEPPTC